MSKSREILKTLGFEGFKSMGELMAGAKSLIPAQMGVYVVLRESDSEPHFLKEGTGGFFKRKNPIVVIVLSFGVIHELIFHGKAVGNSYLVKFIVGIPSCGIVRFTDDLSAIASKASHLQIFRFRNAVSPQSSFASGIHCAERNRLFRNVILKLNGHDTVKSRS